MEGTDHRDATSRRGPASLYQARAAISRAVSARLLPRLQLHTARIAMVVLLFAWPGAGPLSQQFGQWRWRAEFAAGGRSFDNLLDGRTTSSFDQRDLGLDLGMTGFIIHPSIARFDLGLELMLTETDGGNSVDTSRSGLGAEIDLFPTGGYHTRLFFQRQQYDYSGFAAADPFTLLGVPDTSTRYGGRFRLGRGPLRGLLVGVDIDLIDFIDPGNDREIQDNRFLDWSRAGKKLTHHVRVEQRRREFGTIDLDLDDLIVNLDERGSLTESWRWEMSAWTVRRTSEIAGGTAQQNDTHRLTQRFQHDLSNGDLIEFLYRGNLERPELGTSFDSHALATFYRWRPTKQWELAPFAEFVRLTTDTETLDGPRAGTQVNWARTFEKVDARLSGRTSYSRLSATGAQGTTEEVAFSTGINGSLAHGRRQGLRQELEFELARNELRLTRDLLVDLPDLGLPGTTGVTTEDIRRVRLSLSHDWTTRTLSGWGEWSQRTPTGDLGSGVAATDTLSATVQLGGRRMGVVANASLTEVDGGPFGNQTVDSRGVSAHWRPWRHVSLRAAYRDDVRELLLTPDVNVVRLEAGASVSLGRFRLETSYFETDEQVAGGIERTNRGISWSLARRFGGWLPVVSAPARRGTIR